MPITKKRQYFNDDDVPDDSYETERITKCSLSSLCHPEDRDFRPFLSGAIEYCNKLRVLVSIVAKDHIFATLEKQAEEAARRGIPNAEPLLFEPNQNYYSRVKTMVVNGKILKEQGGIAKLRCFAATVQERSSGKYPMSSLHWTVFWNDTICDDGVHAEITC